MHELKYLRHLEDEILPYWMKYGVDSVYGGFYGTLDDRWRADREAPKGLVQQSRFLWTFSAAYRRLQSPRHKAMATHACEFLLRHFRDRDNGGWYYTVNAAGEPLDRRKHVYPHSFVIYALAEYARATGDSDAWDEALATFCLLEEKARDGKHGGYRESFDEHWNEIDQHEDMGVKGRRKTMNSHIHLLESVTTLHAVAEERIGYVDRAIGERLGELITLCTDRVFNRERNSLDLYFEADWTRLDSMTSYGHDIELSWLLDEAAERADRQSETRAVSQALALHSLKGVGKEAGLHYEGDGAGDHIVDTRRVWWVQAEALVGFWNAYSVSKDVRFLEAFRNVERFVLDHMIDRDQGEWHEEINGNGRHQGRKGHLWRDPYHQGRACLEVARRMGEKA